MSDGGNRTGRRDGRFPPRIPVDELEDGSMHRIVEPKIFYVGTPVVLISTVNPDGSPNLAPMSSAWWLGASCQLGLGASSRTAANLRREREAVLNLVQSPLVDAVDRIALLTGEPQIAPHKLARGYRYEPDKFGAAGLTPIAADLVGAPRAAECQIQLEVLVDAVRRFGDGALSFECHVVRSHVDEEILVTGSDGHYSDQYIDPERWDPLIMKFCEFYGEGRNVAPSRLASGWSLPPLERAG
jgi:flavin reductase (DIM6/NTAB) family NADH-FMN oxidoreductase RutF